MNQELADTLRRAVDLCNQKQYAESEPFARQVLLADPDNGIAHRVLGVCLRNLDRTDESIEFIERAISLNPNKAVLHFELGCCYTERGNNPQALECFYKAAELDPDLVEAWNNVGGILENYGMHEEALPWILKSAQRKPEVPEHQYNLGNAQLGMGHLDSAIASFDKAVELRPDYEKAHWHLALCHLLKGEYRKGWEKHEWRARAGQVRIDDYPQNLWKGESLNGKSLLIHAEQGLGDEILFASCFDELTAEAKQTVITCDPRLESLFARSFPDAKVRGMLRRSDGVHIPVDEVIDVQTPAGGIPQFRRNELGDFPNRRSYLQADEEKVAMWRNRLETLGPGLKIGITWRTGGHPNSRRTRVTSLSQWRDLFALPGVEWINLQYGDVVAELEAERKASGTLIHEWDDCDPLIDIDGFAAKLKALDLVIGVGNTSIHLAGALGVESWAILPETPTWRWLVGGVNNDVSPWYPSVYTIRQEVRGEWVPVFSKVREMLCERLQIPVPATQIAAAEVEADDLCEVGPDGAPMSPDKAEAFAKQGSELQQQGRFQEAEQLYKLVLKHFPRHFNCQQLLGSVALDTGRCDMAIRYLKRALDVMPNHGHVQYNLGNAYRKKGDYEKAIEHYRHAIDKIPDLLKAHMNLGVTYMNMGRLGEARNAFQAVLAIDPNMQAAKDNIANLDRAVAAPHFIAAPGVTQPNPTPQQM